jgi:hypothetical protein
MTSVNSIDEQKLAEAALAILSLTLHGKPGASRAWKGMSWDLLDVFYKNGWIYDPVGKQKSVAFTEDGEELATKFMKKHFGKQAQDTL